MMKLSTYSLMAVLVLAGCSSSGGNGMSVNLGLGGLVGKHVGLGTSVNIPIGSGNKTDESGVRVLEEQIVTYFDAQGRTSDNAVKGGFRRELISKRDNNEYIVQDFYEDNSRKRTDPMVLTRAQLMDFRAHPNDGTLTVYAYNGNIMQQQTYRQGRLVDAKY
jgi:hypothetical protein